MSENRLKDYKNKGKDVAVSCIVQFSLDI